LRLHPLARRGQGRCQAGQSSAQARDATLVDRVAAGAWAAAERHWQECGDPYEVAYARWRQAEALLGAQGERADATALIEQAYTTARDLQARPLLEQIEALARRARIDLRDGPSSASKPDNALSRLELTPASSRCSRFSVTG
jgi:hypothetical protein